MLENLILVHFDDVVVADEDDVVADPHARLLGCHARFHSLDPAIDNVDL